MSNPQLLHTFLRSEFDREARNGFARLSQVPDTGVRHFLDYYRSLNASDQDALADASTLWGTLRLAGPAASELKESLKACAAWESWRHELVMCHSRAPYSYYSVPLLRTCLAQAKIDRARGKPSSVPRELEEYAASIRSVKAPELRKHVRSVMRSLLGDRPSKIGGGDWEYRGTLHGSDVVVSIDYGGRLAQLRYDVTVQATEPPIRLKRAGFEVVLGVGLGDWDFIVEENLSHSMQLLSESVAYGAALPQRLPEGCLDDLEA